MKFRIETKPTIEGFNWQEREVIQVVGEANPDWAREDAIAFAAALYPKLEVWVQKVPDYFKADKILNAAAIA
jgi:hypothetical protein